MPGTTTAPSNAASVVECGRKKSILATYPPARTVRKIMDKHHDPELAEYKSPDPNLWTIDYDTDKWVNGIRDADEYWEWGEKQYDPEYLDEIADPARAAEGIFNTIILAVIFWGSLIALLWLANKFIGGG